MRDTVIMLGAYVSVYLLVIIGLAFFLRGGGE
jgi:hypothetical protein